MCVWEAGGERFGEARSTVLGLLFFFVLHSGDFFPLLVIFYLSLYLKKIIIVVYVQFLKQSKGALAGYSGTKIIRLISFMLTSDLSMLPPQGPRGSDAFATDPRSSVQISRFS